MVTSDKLILQMKTKYQFLTLFASVIILGACQRDIVTYNDNYDDKSSSAGQPVISRITTSSDLQTSINQAALTQMIALHGDNLTGVNSIFINDVEVNLSEIYSRRDRITLQIPRILPVDVDNKVKIITRQGQASADLTVIAPPFTVSGLDNEYCFPGDTVKINGTNFDLYNINSSQGKVYFGEQEAVIDSTADKFIMIIVPAAASAGDVVRIQGPQSDVLLTGRFRDSRGVFEDVDNYAGWSNSNCFTDGTVHADDPKPCSGQYTRITRTLGSWEWFDFFASWYTWQRDVFDNPDKYYFKFEINTLKALRTKSVHMNQTGWEWKPWIISEFNTGGKWQTITVEMTDVLNGKVSADFPVDNNIFQFTLRGAEEESVDLCLDNFRIIPKQ